MSPASVFEFGSFREYLKYRVDLHLRGASGVKRSNLSKFSRTVGYRSPSVLSMVLKGRRIPSDALVEAVADLWGLKVTEREHLRLLAQLEKSKTKGKDVSPILKKLERSSRGKVVHRYSLSQFELIRDWYCQVIKELIGSPGFSEDPQWISRRLRRKVTVPQVEQAIAALLSVGVARRNPQTGKLEPVVGYTESTHDVPSSAIRAHHRGMLDRAAEALEEQEVSARHFNSLSLRVDPARVAEAKEAILHFVRGFNSEFGTPDSNRVYQLNLQFFEHTRGEPAGTPSKEPDNA